MADAIGPRFRALVLVAGTLGLRWSEAIGLRVADVNFLGRTVTVSQTLAEVGGRLEVAPAKSRSSVRTLSVPGFLLEELADHISTQRNQPEVQELLFTGRHGAPLRRNFAARIFKPAVAAAGLDPALTFHGLRHVARSLMVEAGEHPRVIQQRLGHATARLSMELYAHVPGSVRPGGREEPRRTVRFHDGHGAGTNDVQRGRVRTKVLVGGLLDDAEDNVRNVEVRGSIPLTSTEAARRMRYSDGVRPRPVDQSAREVSR